MKQLLILSGKGGDVYKRQVCCLPENSKFGPLDLKVDDENIVRMTVDEYEAIRLSLIHI